MKTPALSALAALALAAGASAQEVTFRGQIEDVSGTSNQFFLDCTDAQLTSSAFDLNLFMDQELLITGQWNGSIGSPSVVVTDLSPTAETFEIGGGAKIGDTSNLTFFGAPGTLALGFLGVDSSFIPFDGGSGVILFDPSLVVLRVVGTIGGSGQLQVDFPIPNDPTLIGVDVFGQGALVDGFDVTLTASDCKTISD